MTYVDMDAVLTTSQQTCLRLVAKRMTSKEIARELEISPHTVDMHIKAAMRRLGVTSRVVAAQLLLKGGEEHLFTTKTCFGVTGSTRTHTKPENMVRTLPSGRNLADVDYRGTLQERRPSRAHESGIEEEWRVYRPEQVATGHAEKKEQLTFWQWAVVIFGLSLLAANLFVASIVML